MNDVILDQSQIIWQGEDAAYGEKCPARITVSYQKGELERAVFRGKLLGRRKTAIRPIFIYETLTHKDSFGVVSWERRTTLPGYTNNMYL